MTRKSIAYSYPSSINADKFGFDKTGCFTVATSEDSNPPIALAGFMTLPEAWAFAETLPFVLSRYTL